MKPSLVERDLLWAGVEDITGLYQALSEVESTCPGISEALKRSLAEETLRDLAKRRLIRFYRHRWWREGEPVPIEESEIEGVLADPASWERPSGDDGLYVAYITTEEGAKVSKY